MMHGQTKIKFIEKQVGLRTYHYPGDIMNIFAFSEGTDD